MFPSPLSVAPPLSVRLLVSNTWLGAVLRPCPAWAKLVGTTARRPRVAPDPLWSP